MLSIPALLPELLTVYSHINDTLELALVFHLRDNAISIFERIIEFFGDK